MKATAGMRPPVLWYVHHRGTGHWRQAMAAAARLERPTVFASSRPPPAPLRRDARFVELADDRDDAPYAPTARGRLHWAPVGNRGLLGRHRGLLDLVAETGPVVAVVDVSVEMALLLRVSGVPVISVRMPGRRDDDAHRLGFAISDVVVAPVPESLGIVPVDRLTRHVGFVSNIEPGRRPWRPGGPLAVVSGTGGSRLDLRTTAHLARRLPHRRIDFLGLPAGTTDHGDLPPNLVVTGWLADPEPALVRASVVIGNAGVGTVADALAVGRPLVVVPEPRPHGEQMATAAGLAHHALASVVSDPADVDALVAAIDAAEQRGPGDTRLAAGADAFARLVADVAASQPVAEAS